MNMQDWNIVVTVRDTGFKRILKFLQDFGEVRKTEFFNVLVLRVDDVSQFTEDMKEEVEADPSLFDFMNHVIPTSTWFTFQTPQQFETKARDAVLPWVKDLVNKSFHVRVHRRGFKKRLSSLEEEQFLDGFLLGRLEEAGTPGRICFENPDVIIAVEIVGQRAGLSLWTREDRQSYSFLNLD
jgi:tRNA(Ser,Leu) C12 N-acetylase TAN1